MASCPKCGRVKLKKNRQGERSCPRCGPLRGPLFARKQRLDQLAAPRNEIAMTFAIGLAALAAIALSINPARGAPRCPTSLACGCRLANHFGISGKDWRKLWVARNWLHFGSRAPSGCIGCVVVLSRGRGGHVGIVRGYTKRGVTAYSWGNRRVGWFTHTYSKKRVLGYRYINASHVNEFAARTFQLKRN